MCACVCVCACACVCACVCVWVHVRVGVGVCTTVLHCVSLLLKQCMYPTALYSVCTRPEFFLEALPAHLQHGHIVGAGEQQYVNDVVHWDHLFRSQLFGS